MLIWASHSSQQRAARSKYGVVVPEEASVAKCTGSCNVVLNLTPLTKCIWPSSRVAIFQPSSSARTEACTGSSCSASGPPVNATKMMRALRETLLYGRLRQCFIPLCRPTRKRRLRQLLQQPERTERSIFYLQIIIKLREAEVGAGHITVPHSLPYLPTTYLSEC